MVAHPPHPVTLNSSFFILPPLIPRPPPRLRPAADADSRRRRGRGSGGRSCAGSRAKGDTAAAAKTKSDSIHDAARYIAQITPQNREKVSYEVQLHLNKWLQTVPARKSDVVPGELIEGLPPDMRAATGLDANAAGQFDAWDVEYLYQCRLYRQLSSWIIERPLRDSLVQTWLAKQAEAMPPQEFGQLEQACKLFDWAARNIVVYGEATEVERLADDPRVPLSDSGIGYRYLPWQTILYARGDFVERGRVFTSLAQQRELSPLRISIYGSPEGQGRLRRAWPMGTRLAIALSVSSAGAFNGIAFRTGPTKTPEIDWPRSEIKERLRKHARRGRSGFARVLFGW